MGFLSNLFGKKGEPSVEPVKDRDDLQQFKRACWLPVLEDGDGEVTASKFAGTPYLADGESWPECPNCNNPIQLFLQLNSEDLPGESGKPWGDGLLQFFYCTNSNPHCEVDCGAWAAFAKSVVVRVVPAGASGSRYSDSPVLNAFPPKLITGWNTADDFPNWEEFKDLGVDLDDGDGDKLSETYPRGGEKLLGWPAWVQGLEYPNCPECDSVMQLVFQIDSEMSLPYMFGDVGIGHITQCPNHTSITGFGWAC